MFQSQDVSKATFLPEALGKNLFPCLFYLLEIVCIPWIKPLSSSSKPAMLSSPISSSLFQTLPLTSHSLHQSSNLEPPSFPHKDPYDYRKIQDTLSMSRSWTNHICKVLFAMSDDIVTVSGDVEHLSGEGTVVPNQRSSTTRKNKAQLT